MKTKFIGIILLISLAIVGTLLGDVIFKLNLVEGILLPVFGIAGFCYVVKGYEGSIENFRSSGTDIYNETKKRKRKWASVKNVRK